ncbi:hypothetical protein NBRC111894_3950 [Sporolactobacillus inulinus]|uniref:Uncharacterized protein n=1 Tax=Sporolactobacillus inulinus TaxID=2078 RepID=A0A4Y1ZGT2_9BACL|nr:hypothetical protein NBRC111894_3950 [Sporolactobacillus inulinus]
MSRHNGSPPKITAERILVEKHKCQKRSGNCRPLFLFVIVFYHLCSFILYFSVLRKIHSVPIITIFYSKKRAKGSALALLLL